MSEYSISASLRTTPKAVAGLAPNAFSERFLDAGCLGVCPTRYPVDDVQRCADPRSLVTLTAGCDSAAERVNIETAVERPYYSVHPLNVAGIAQKDAMYMYTPGGGYDTMGTRRDEAFRVTEPGYPKEAPGCACNPAYDERARQQETMWRYYDKLRFKNGCSY